MDKEYPLCLIKAWLWMIQLGSKFYMSFQVKDHLKNILKHFKGFVTTSM
jgi:hypothetical protein